MTADQSQSSNAEPLEEGPGERTGVPNPLLMTGHEVRTGEPVPVSGAFDVVDHPECGRSGTRALTAGQPAPTHDDCGGVVTWRFVHHAPSVAPG
jgi:hypothetical protein